MFCIRRRWLSLITILLHQSATESATGLARADSLLLRGMWFFGQYKAMSLSRPPSNLRILRLLGVCRMARRRPHFNISRRLAKNSGNARGGQLPKQLIHLLRGMGHVVIQPPRPGCALCTTSVNSSSKRLSFPLFTIRRLKAVSVEWSGAASSTASPRKYLANRLSLTKASVRRSDRSYTGG